MRFGLFFLLLSCVCVFAAFVRLQNLSYSELFLCGVCNTRNMQINALPIWAPFTCVRDAYHKVMCITIYIKQRIVEIFSTQIDKLRKQINFGWSLIVCTVVMCLVKWRLVYAYALKKICINLPSIHLLHICKHFTDVHTHSCNANDANIFCCAKSSKFHTFYWMNRSKINIIMKIICIYWLRQSGYVWINSSQINKFMR